MRWMTQKETQAKLWAIAKPKNNVGKTDGDGQVAVIAEYYNSSVSTITILAIILIRK
jgi:hypothetical protein